MSQSNAVDYGPLQSLIGVWRGDRGMDIAPDPDGTEENPYYETIVFQAIGDVTNAEQQTLAALRYHQEVRRKSDDKVFHDQTGYWMWDKPGKVIMQSLVIPRGVALLAGGVCEAPSSSDSEVVINVIAKLDDPDWGIIQSPFMRDNARTLEFSHNIVINNDKLTYSERTLVDIYHSQFEHTDGNALARG